MSIEKIPNPEQEPEKKEESKELTKPLTWKDVEIVQSTRPASVKEIMEEAKKQGRRPLTLQKMQELMKSGTPNRIVPKEGDVVIDVQAENIKEENEEPKQLSEESE